MESPLIVRPMTPADVVGAERVTDAAYAGVDERYGSRGVAARGRRSVAASARWAERATARLATDGPGCWVAERDDELLGAVLSARRDLTWVLNSFAVSPAARGQGVGRALLDAAGRHSAGCLRAMLCSSSDPVAVRRYVEAGFALHPFFLAAGVVDRSRIPTDRGRVRPGTAADRDLMDSVDRRVRDAAHGPDHEPLLRQHPLLVVDRHDGPHDGEGYAYVGEDGSPVLLAATSRRTATTLLWEALALSPAGAPVRVDHVTAGQVWALRALTDARLDLHTQGALGVRGMTVPAPYLPHGSLL